MYRGNRRDHQPPRSTDTLHVRVTDLQYTVDESVVMQVFSPVAPVTRVHMLPPQASERVAIVQFADVRGAESAMNERNGRNIFNNCCKMTISFTNWESFVPPQPLSVLPQPVQAPMPQQQFIEGPYAGQRQSFPHHHQQHQAMGHGANSYYASPAAASNMPSMQPGGSAGLYHHQAMLMHPQLQVGRGAMASGRGGIFIPTLAHHHHHHHAAMMGFNPLLAGAPLQPQQATGPTLFVSVALVPEAASLYSLFVLMEAFAGVVSIRRNQNKREIVTVKMASTADTDTISKLLRQVPFSGGKLNAKPFPNYTERHPATAEGDPKDPTLLQYDFTQTKHRNTAQRTQFSASTVLKLTGAANQTEGAVMGFLNERGFFPERLAKDEAEGFFTVHMDSVENAVKMLVECQWSVCGEEKSNFAFLEKEAEAAVAEETRPQQE
jgi:hypothetical protein